MRLFAVLRLILPCCVFRPWVFVTQDWVCLLYCVHVTIWYPTLATPQILGYKYRYVCHSYVICFYWSYICGISPCIYMRFPSTSIISIVLVIHPYACLVLNMWLEYPELMLLLLMACMPSLCLVENDQSLCPTYLSGQFTHFIWYTPFLPYLYSYNNKYNKNLWTRQSNQHKHNKNTDRQHHKKKWAIFTYSIKETENYVTLYK
jgi:hypothetical protein